MYCNTLLIKLINTNSFLNLHFSRVFRQNGACRLKRVFRRGNNRFRPLAVRGSTV